MKFNWLDIVFIALAVRGLFVGVKRGILGELVLSAGFLASIIASIYVTTPQGAQFLAHLSLGIPLGNNVIAWGVLIVGIFVAMILSVIVKKISHLIFKSIIDKIGGGVLGIARAVLFSAILLTALILWPIEYLMTHTQESVIGKFATEKVNEGYGIVLGKMTPGGLEQIADEVDQAVQGQSEDKKTLEKEQDKDSQ